MKNDGGGVIGRADDLSELRRLVETNRLVTITGPPGIGASALARELAGSAIDRFPDGVWVADLGPVTEAAYITEALAIAAGLLEPAGVGVGTDERSLLARVMERGCGREVLVILDHCTHLHAECALLADMMLASCPDIHIVATSDKPLEIAGEVVHALSGLNGEAAVELLSAGTGEETMDHETASRICTALDGMPLAVELAAEATAHLPAAELAGRLEEAAGSGTRDPGVMLATVFELRRSLLSAAERLLLDRTAVFSGPFDVEAAAIICSGGQVKKARVPEMLERLVAAGLLGSGPGPALRLQDGLRDLGRRKLIESGQETELLSAHARHFTRLSARASAGIAGPERGEWLDHLELHRHDLRSAFGWALEAEPGTALELASHLGWYWYVSGRRHEGRHKLEAAIRRAGSTNPRHRAGVAFCLALHEWFEGRISAAMAYAEEAEHLHTELGDPQEAAVASTLVAVFARYLGDNDRAVHLEQAAGDILGDDPAGWQAAVAMLLDANAAAAAGDVDRARTAALRALAAFDNLQDEWGIAASRFALGVATRMAGDPAGAVARMEGALDAARSLRLGADVPALLVELGNLATLSGDVDQAGTRYAEAVRIAQRRGDQSAIAFARNGQGVALRMAGKLTDAVQHHQEALDIYRRQGNRSGLAYTLCQLGRAAQQAGDEVAARRYSAEGLEQAAESRDPLAVAAALEGAASLALGAGNAGAASTLLGAAGGFRTATGTALPALDSEDLEHLATAAAGAAGPDFDTLSGAGRMMDMATAVQAGREALADLATGDHTRPEDR